MLELVKNKAQKNDDENKNLIGSHPSTQFIDSLIAKIKHAHHEDVWDSEMEALMKLVNQNEKRPYLTAL